MSVTFIKCFKGQTPRARISEDRSCQEGSWGRVSLTEIIECLEGVETVGRREGRRGWPGKGLAGKVLT